MKRTNKEKPYIKRPLVLGTIFYILGLIGGSLHYDIMQISLFFIGLTGITTIIVWATNNLYNTLYLLIAIIAGVSMITEPTLKEESFFLDKDGETIEIQGRVIDVKEYEYSNNYIIQPHKNYMLKSKLSIVDSNRDSQVTQGDMITVEGKVERLLGPRNPGGFDQRKYFLIRGISSKLKAKQIKINKNQNTIPILKKASNYYSYMFEDIMPWNEAQLMKAMLLGDKLFLDSDTKELYKGVGIAHVLAISGLHISIIAGFLWWIFDKLKLSKVLQSVLVLIILWIYAGFTGFSTSIIRAVIMISVAIVGELIHETSDSITSLAFAALILLAYKNLNLWDVGFQLSFISVAGIILISPFLDKIYRIPKKIRLYLSPTLAVTLAITPIIAYYYYIITPISLVTNLILTPIIMPLIVIGFITMLIYPFSKMLAKLLMSICYFLLKAIELLSKIAMKIPFSTLIVGKPYFIDIMIYITIILLLLWYLSLNLKDRFRLRYYFICLSLCIMSIVPLKRILPKDLMVTFLDVGQGDSIVIRTPNNKIFVIDGGPPGKGRVVEEFLKYNGIRKIDGIILSHAHQDHMAGLGELATNYPVEKLFLSKIPVADIHFQKFYDIIQKEKIPVYICKEKDTIRDNNVEIKCIFPFRQLDNLEGNDSSLVLSLKYGNVSYYFTGDIEENYEKEIINFIDRSSINILKVPHHGSATSSSEELISKIDPDVAVISCGKNNLYNHPRKEVLERYIQNNTTLKVTKDVGAIMTYSNKEKLKVQSMEDIERLWKQ